MVKGQRIRKLIANFRSLRVTPISACVVELGFVQRDLFLKRHILIKASELNFVINSELGWPIKLSFSFI